MIGVQVVAQQVGVLGPPAAAIQMRSSDGKSQCEHVVNAIITSRLDYCNSLLCGTSVNNIARLQRMHNSAARLILRRPRSDSAMPLLCILHWLPVAHRIDFKLLVFTYKAVHGDAPKYLCDLVCPYKPTRALRSTNNNMLTVLRTHVKAGDNSFAVAAATLWNTLPNDIKTSDCLSTFKARLKTHFFRLSFLSNVA